MPPARFLATIVNLPNITRVQNNLEILAAIANLATNQDTTLSVTQEGFGAASSNSVRSSQHKRAGELTVISEDMVIHGLTKSDRTKQKPPKGWVIASIK